MENGDALYRRSNTATWQQLRDAGIHLPMLVNCGEQTLQTPDALGSVRGVGERRYAIRAAQQ